MQDNFTKIFTGHKVKTSSVGWAPSGVFLASGDVEGNLKIFRFDDLSLKKEYPKALGGIIRGVVWNDESNKIFFFGDGKQFLARVILWDSGNNVGDISGHSKVILSGDMRRTRPFRIITGSEDFAVNVYEATPAFKFSKSNTEHTNYSSCVKFSPDDSLFVSVGFDKKIFIYDGKEGTILHKLAEDKSPNNHTAAIISVCWIDNTTIATTSLDKSVKVWDLNEKVCKYTLYPKDKLDISEMGCGIASNGNLLISLSLSGVLNYWKVSDLTEGKLPDSVFDGHQGNITGIIKTENGIVSSDTIGKLSKII
jgi:WD40 repeat protein